MQKSYALSECVSSKLLYFVNHRFCAEDGPWHLQMMMVIKWRGLVLFVVVICFNAMRGSNFMHQTELFHLSFCCYFSIRMSAKSLLFYSALVYLC